MNTRGNDEPWLERALGLLQQSADGLDAATLSRLNRARQAALALPRRSMPLMWGFAAACAFALVLALGLGRRDLSPDPPTVAVPVADSGAIDALASDDENAEMVDDLDFYAWLDAQQHDDEG
jgi:hypothetical protein